MVKYIVIDSGSDASRQMFFDINNMPNAIRTSQLFDIKNPVLKLLNKIHMSGRINRKISLPFRDYWDKYCVLERTKNDITNDYIILLTNVSAKKFRVEYLQELKKYKNVHLVLVAVDSFVDSFLSPLNLMQKVNFELVYSFDKKDCEKYGLIFTCSQYSKRNNIASTNKKCDLFFIGRAKDRLELLQNIVKKANAYGLHSDFYILGAPKNKRYKIDGIHYINKIMTYDEVLPLVNSAQCLVDIVQRGQSGFTMRTYEAIFYNKKLLTNNKSILEFPYFKKGYMYFFEDTAQIDFRKLGVHETIDYEYQGEYSPIRLLEDAKRRIFNE